MPRIPDLPAANVLGLEDIIVVVQGSGESQTTRRGTVQQVVDNVPGVAATPAVLLAPTNQRQGYVEVDVDAGVIRIPRIRIQVPGQSLISIGAGDTRQELPLSTTVESRRFYYINLQAALLGSTETFGDPAPSASILYFGQSNNGSFQSYLNGLRVQYPGDPIDGLTLQPKVTGLTHKVVLRDSARSVMIDRQNSLVRIPRFIVAREGQPNVVFTPGGGATYFDLPLSVLLSVQYYYYADLAANSVTYAEAGSLPAQSDTVVFLGASNNGSFANYWGLRLYDTQDAPDGSVGVLDALAVQSLAQFVRYPDIYEAALPYNLGDTTWYQHQGAHFDSIIRQSTAGVQIDLTNMVNAERPVFRATNPMRIFAGHGKTWDGTTDNCVDLVAGTSVQVQNVQGSRILHVLSGMPWIRKIAEPVHALSMLWVGQSEAERALLNGGVGGLTRGLRNANWLQTPLALDFYHIDGATGSTALLKSSLSDPGDPGYWVDDSAWPVLADGPALTTAIAAMTAAVAAGQPAPTRAWWNQGQGDTAKAETNDVTVERLKEGNLYAWGRLKAEAEGLGATGFGMIVAPMGSWVRYPFSERFRGATAVRQAQLQAVADASYAHMGQSNFDLARGPLDVHRNLYGYEGELYRGARVYANAFHGQTNRLGPTLASATLSADKSQVRLAFATTGRLVVPSAGAMTGPYPYGFLVIPPGETAASADPIPLVSGYVDGQEIVLDAGLGVDLTDHLLAWPAGFYGDAMRMQFPRDNDGHLGIPGQPLQPFVTGALS